MRHSMANPADHTCVGVNAGKSMVVRHKIDGTTGEVTLFGPKLITETTKKITFFRKRI